MNHEYAFDVKLFASVRVKAESEEQARKILNEAMDCASCNAGAWPNGDPIVFEASQDGEADLFEVDGEADLFEVERESARKAKQVPKDWPVQPVNISTYAPIDHKAIIATCGECGRSWDDSIAASMTPAPAGRCPFEALHGSDR